MHENHRTLQLRRTVIKRTSMLRAGLSREKIARALLGTRCVWEVAPLVGRSRFKFSTAAKR